MTICMLGFVQGWLFLTCNYWNAGLCSIRGCIPWFHTNNHGRLVRRRQLVSNLCGCKGREGKCPTLHRLVLNNIYYNQLINQMIASRRWTNQIMTHPKLDLLWGLDYEIQQTNNQNSWASMWSATHSLF
jgi:hypothetical protein